MAVQGIKLHWDNAPGHTSVAVCDWLAAKAIAVLPYPLYLPDLAPGDFFLLHESESAVVGPKDRDQELQDDLGRGGCGHGGGQVHSWLSAMVREEPNKY